MRMKLRVLSALLALTSCALVQGYSTLGHTWGTSSVQYYVNPQSIYVSSSAATSAIQTAAAGWHNQSRANISLVYAGTTTGSSLVMNNKNEVFFRNDSNGNVAESYVWWDGSGRLVDGDIVFHEGGYQFFAQSGCTGGIYIENVAIHEFGHMLGLQHSSVAGATMEPAMPSYCDTTQLTLEADDISGIESLYPPSGGGSTPPSNTAPNLTVTSPANNASFLDTALVSFSASASDSQDGNLTGSIRWTSSLLPGITLGTGGSFARTLPIGTHLLTASVTDSGNLSAARTVQVVVTLALPPSGPVLTARAYKVRGREAVDLTWSGLAIGNVDVYRNGTRILSSPNTGATTDNLGSRGGGTYTYQVCAAGSTTACTNQSSVTF